MSDTKLEIVLTARAMTAAAFNQVKDQCSDLTSSVFSLNTAVGVLAGTGGFAYLIDQSLEQTAEMYRNSQMAGVSAQAFQELSYAADHYMVTQDALTDGLKELSLRAEEFVVTGAGPGKEAFERLGYSEAALNAKLADTPGLLVEIVDKLQSMDQAARLRIADEIFGGQGGEQFVAMINGGSDALHGFIKEANDLGLVLSDKTAAGAVQADREIQKLSRQLNVNFNRVVAELAPDLSDVAGQMSDWVTANKEFLTQDVPGHIGSITKKITTFVESDAAKKWVKILTFGGGGGGLFSVLEDLGGLDQMTLLEKMQAEYDNLSRKISDARKYGDSNMMLSVPFWQEQQEALAKKISEARNAAPYRNDFDWREARYGPLSSGTNTAGDASKRTVSDLVTITPDPWGDLSDMDAGYDDVTKAIQLAELAENNRQLALQESIDTQNRLAEAMDDTYDLDFGHVNDGLEENQKAVEAFQEEFRRATMTTTQFELAELKKRYDYYAQHVDDKAKLDEWFAAETRRITKENADSYENAFSGWASHYASDLWTMVKESEASFSSISGAFGDMLGEMIMQKYAAEPALSFAGSALDWLTGALTGSSSSSAASYGTTTYDLDYGSAPSFDTGGIMGAGGKKRHFPAWVGEDEVVGYPNQLAAMFGGSGGGVDIQIIDQRSSSSPAIETSESQGANGRKQVRLIIKEEVKTMFGDGSMDKTMRSNFGLSRQAVRR